MSIFHGIESEIFTKLVRVRVISRSGSNERQMLIHWAKLWERIPVVNLTNTIALYTWIGVLLVFYLLSNKIFSQMIPVCTNVFTCFNMHDFTHK